MKNVEKESRCRWRNRQILSSFYILHFTFLISSRYALETEAALAGQLGAQANGQQAEKNAGADVEYRQQAIAILEHMVRFVFESGKRRIRPREADGHKQTEIVGADPGNIWPAQAFGNDGREPAEEKGARDIDKKSAPGKGASQKPGRPHAHAPSGQSTQGRTQ
jgi:hypothetical protein